MTELFTFKIIVAGPFGAGKTTLIRNISTTAVVGTDVRSTGEDAETKSATTVGIEYGRYTLDEPGMRAELVLIGTPGQLRFGAVRESAARGMDGMVLLVDGSHRATWSDAAHVLTGLRETTPAPVVVGVNRTDGGGGQLEELRSALGLDPSVPVLPCDVADPRAARDLLVALLISILEQLDEEYEDEEVPVITGPIGGDGQSTRVR